MAYSELIKNFDNIRSYMREFFIYGFKTREEYDKKVLEVMIMSDVEFKVIWETWFLLDRRLQGRIFSFPWTEEV